MKTVPPGYIIARNHNPIENDNWKRAAHRAIAFVTGIVHREYTQADVALAR